MRPLILSSLVSFAISSVVDCSVFTHQQSLPQSAALLQISTTKRYSSEGKQWVGEDTKLELSKIVRDDETNCSYDESVARRNEGSAGTQLKLIHITKTGGTSVECWGRRHGFFWGWYWPELRNATDLRGNLSPFSRNIQSEAWHVPPRFFHKDPYKGYDVFAVVRDPYARAISEFRCPWFGFHGHFQEGKEKMGSDVALALRAAATADDLNGWILKKLLKGTARPPFVSGHMVPQYLYVFGENGQRQVPEENVLRMEQLDRDFADLLARYNITGGPLIHINDPSMKQFGVEDLSGKARQLIEEEYSEDFRYFGYPKFS
eukprot:CAMPEP_0169197886 /NCGR_PEP_ID=MMETSP1016-20121227/8518_1 /TAXON_ID=342587 /ORGANISM="Karlodinium micrum, Strain CCMP2283" /LENGTH=317 /DNA_ID=CAMNT_0009274585 /DNA_START=73 /DNA_END=1022 /DNA_ORIENTATION=+